MENCTTNRVDSPFGTARHAEVCSAACMRCWVLLALCLFALVGMGARSYGSAMRDSTVTARAVVLDAHTGNPLAYATVYCVRDARRGTVSNMQGRFMLKGLLPTDSVAVAMIGYERGVFPVEQLRGSGSVIPLATSVVEIDSVVVFSKGLLTEILESVKGSFPENYPMLRGVLRKQVAEEGKCVFMGECEVVCANQKPYEIDPRVRIENPVITKNEATDGYLVSLNLNSNLSLYPNLWVLEDTARRDEFEWHVQVARTSEGAGRMYRLHYRKQRDGRLVDQGEISYDAEEKAVVRVEREVEVRLMKAWYIRRMSLSDGWAKQLLVYRKHPGAAGKYVLHYSRTDMGVTYTPKGHSPLRYVFSGDFLVTDVGPQGGKPPRKKPNFDPLMPNRKLPVVEQSALRVIPPDYE